MVRSTSSDRREPCLLSMHGAGDAFPYQTTHGRGVLRSPHRPRAMDPRAPPAPQAGTPDPAQTGNSIPQVRPMKKKDVEVGEIFLIPVENEFVPAKVLYLS